MATITLEKQMEELSFAYLQAVCSKVGVALIRHNLDADGIDGELKKVVVLSNGLRFNSTLHFQLKSTCKRLPENEDAFFYDLKTKNYEDLRRASTTPNFLFVHIFPEEFDSALIHSPESLQIQHCAYWANASDFIERNATSSVRVTLSKANMASPENIDSLLQDLAEAANAGI